MTLLPHDKHCPLTWVASPQVIRGSTDPLPHRICFCRNSNLPFHMRIRDPNRKMMELREPTFFCGIKDNLGTNLCPFLWPTRPDKHPAAMHWNALIRHPGFLFSPWLFILFSTLLTEKGKWGSSESEERGRETDKDRQRTTILRPHYLNLYGIFWHIFQHFCTYRAMQSRVKFSC